MAQELSIGKLATLAGVSVETVRYYQRRDLLELPARLAGGQRRYGPDQVKRLHFIKRAQSLGFTLAEVLSLLELADGRCCADARALAVRKLQLIETKLAELTAMRQALGELIHQCDLNTGEMACPIIQAMNRD
ncbi:MerR family transcriptional regulator [Pseudomonas sp. BN417]|uniref:MerR family transcriptional regulator n=1 Tax=Pseudomonas sp. BN417 TaxID=2567890 RepID=UPI0024583429|nr:MerR family DNA-binding protein [Pseudomonas sp. BN417]MDH4554649.1 MerR family transcriptional regulator [Pseudomonas sp. BN417]